MSSQPSAPADLVVIAGNGDGLLGKLLASLSDAVKAELLSSARLRDVPAGTVVVETGAETDEIGYVIDGTLAMTQIVDPSRTHIVGLLVPTDVYGRLFDGPSGYRIETLSPTRILAFPRVHFERILMQHPEAERLFLVHLLDEMDAAREWLLLISGRRVVNRVASFLSILARRSRAAGRADPVTLHLPLARKDLAHYLGTRKETLSRAFHELEDKGILRILSPDRFQILDAEALVDISGDDLTLDGARPAARRR